MKELEETITFLEQQIEKLKEIRNNVGNNHWNPEYGEEYFYVDMDLTICSYMFNNHKIDIKLLNANNCFQTEEEAQKYAEHFKQILKNREL
jgi:urease accessory protein UreE